MATFKSSRVPEEKRYRGPVTCPSLWTGAHRDGTENPKVAIRVLAAHPDEGYLYEWIRCEDLPEVKEHQLGRTTDEQLRLIFRPVEPLPEHSGGGGAQEGVRRIAIREATEEEAPAYGRFGDSGVPRFLIVNADEPDEALHYGGNLNRGEGSDWILNAIGEARAWERRGYKLVLTREQKVIEAVGEVLDLNTWFPPAEIVRDPAAAAAKFDRICRIVCPEAFWDPFTNERELFNPDDLGLSRRRREEREEDAVA